MTEQITVSVADIREMGARRAGRVGGPRKGAPVVDGGKPRTFRLSDGAAETVKHVAGSLGVSESAIMEVVARALASIV